MMRKIKREKIFHRKPPPVATIICFDCKKEYPTLFILKDEIWDSVTQDCYDKVLCLNCFEKRLKRPIIFEDLKHCGNYNTMMLGAYIFARAKKTPEFDDSFLREI